MLILASASPRRADLLRQAGLGFRVEESAAEELTAAEIQGQNMPISIAAMENARRKSAEVAKRFPDDAVLGADTIVSIERQIFGKPRNAEDAKRMLRALSGRAHEVFTGIALAYMGRITTGYALTSVEFSPLTVSEIETYVGTGEPFGKAGAYAIQGRAAAFIPGINGSFSNVVGLPIHDTVEMLRSRGVPIFCR